MGTRKWIVAALLVFGLPLSVNAMDADRDQISRGAQAWADNCARCHNMRPAQDFPDHLWRPIVAHMRVRAGLTGRQARDILAFLQQANNPGTEAAKGHMTSALTSGHQIYAQNCLVCHGPDGSGAVAAVPDLTAPEGRLSEPYATLLANIIQGVQTPGSAMAMPPKGGNPALTEQELKRALEYMLTMFGQNK